MLEAVDIGVPQPLPLATPRSGPQWGSYGVPEVCFLLLERCSDTGGLSGTLNRGSVEQDGHSASTNLVLVQIGVNKHDSHGLFALMLDCPLLIVETAHFH